MADSGCAKAFGITAIVFSVLGFLGILALAGLGGLASKRPMPPRPTTTTETAAETNQRLFLQDSRWHDDVRAGIFRTTLVNSGERCDRVVSATMSNPGVWSVGCAPGHVFVFKFDEDGSLLSATRLR